MVEKCMWKQTKGTKNVPKPCLLIQGEPWIIFLNVIINLDNLLHFIFAFNEILDNFIFIFPKIPTLWKFCKMNKLDEYKNYPKICSYKQNHKSYVTTYAISMECNTFKGHSTLFDVQLYYGHDNNILWSSLPFVNALIFLCNGHSNH
jgi:hypothetical protein